jgi:hypothetical protein
MIFLLPGTAPGGEDDVPAGLQLTSAISDRVTTNDPDGCNSIF